MRSLQVVGSLVLAAGGMSAQSIESFEVASIKPSRPGTRLTSTLDGAQFRCTAHTLMHLLMSAYPDIQVQPWNVSGGPAWLNNDSGSFG